MKHGKQSIGYLRYLMDKRQIAGLLMVTSICALIQPLTGIAELINGTPVTDGALTTSTSGIAFSALFGNLCVVTTGVLSLLAGYAELFHDFGHKYFTAFLFCFMQTALIPYVTGMTMVGRATVAGATFSENLDPPSDGRFVGAMGILGIFAYGFGLLGSVSFLQFSLYTFQAGKPQDRDGNYYRGRMLFYSFILFVAGISQFLLGAKLLADYGNDLAPGVVAVAFYVIRFPALAVVVGLFQLLNGVWGIFKYFGLDIGGAKYGGTAFVVSIWFGWLLQVLLQVITQPSSLPGMAGIPNPPTVAAFSFGLNLMPAYLASKASSMPPIIASDYYDPHETASDDETEIPNNQDNALENHPSSHSIQV